VGFIEIKGVPQKPKNCHQNEPFICAYFAQLFHKPPSLFFIAFQVYPPTNLLNPNQQSSFPKTIFMCLPSKFLIHVGWKKRTSIDVNEVK
jgi:hypothetical protein